MGKWKNAPVIYVIVQVRFSPVLSLQTYISEIQEHFRRNGFPAFVQRFNFQLGLSVMPPNNTEPAASPIPVERTPAYVFSNRDSSQSFVLEQNGLTLHVTDYEDFSRFLDLFLKPLNRINEVVKPDSSERIGLRYFDAVLPHEGAKIQNYFIPEVLGLSSKPLAGSLQHSFSETMFRNGDTSTVSRVLVRDGQIAFPPDLVSFPISINPRFTGQVGPHATIDTDSSQQIRAEMDPSKIRSTLEGLRKSVDQAFHAVVTDFALSDWK
jgi:uncharacterized protein (TIGR04255 family)